MNVLDTLTPAQQHSIVVQFQQHETVKEIIDHLKEDVDLIVSETTIRRWLKARGIGRIFYSDEMRYLKTRQWALIKEKKVYLNRITKTHLSIMINERSITPADLIGLITSVDPEKVKIAWMKQSRVYNGEVVPDRI